MKISELQLEFDGDWSDADRRRVSELLERAAAPLLDTLGGATASAWRLRRSAEIRGADMYMPGRIITIDPAATPERLIHEVVHAWHGLDCRYDLIEEGLTSAAAGLVLARLGLADTLVRREAVSEKMAAALAMGPAYKAADFGPLSYYRYQVLCDAWLLAAGRDPDGLKGLIAALRQGIRPEWGLEEHLRLLRQIAPVAWTMMENRLFATHDILLNGIRELEGVSLPFTAMAFDPASLYLRVVSLTKTLNIINDRGRKFPMLWDDPADVPIDIHVQGPGPRPVERTVLPEEGLAYVELSDVPAGKYVVRSRYNGLKDWSDRLEFTVDQ